MNFTLKAASKVADAATRARAAELEVAVNARVLFAANPDDHGSADYYDDGDGGGGSASGPAGGAWIIKSLKKLNAS